MKIFISYRRNDSGREVGRIRDRLKAEFGEQSVFRDLVDIPAGVDFRTVLDRETKSCDVMLVIIGPIWASITDGEGNKRLFKEGDFTRIEVETGLERLEKGTIRVFPVLVQNAGMPSAAELPSSLGQLHNQNAISIHDDPYFDFDMDRLIRDIKNSNTYHPVEKTADFEPQTVYVPEGPFMMGSQPGEGIPAHESPRHEVDLPAYCIGAYPVTNAQYAEFISQNPKTDVNSLLRWEGRKVPEGKEDYPVAGVTWLEAVAYCNWLSERTGHTYGLPNEAQWEKACRGGRQSLYPWGDEFDPQRTNHGKSELAPVDAYLAQNEFGLFDLVGNIRQWTCTLWGLKLPVPDSKYYYPWEAERRNDTNASLQIRRVIRGCSFKESAWNLRCSVRNGQVPGDAGWTGAGIGFRVVMKV
jgi:formylglycine-generating enzyme required for sulfatase activity